MKKILLVLVLGVAFSTTAQKISLKKGSVVDSLRINDSIPESFALYLPKTFDPIKRWPVLFVYDMQGRGRQTVNMFRGAAEKEGYILVSSNSVHDSLPIAKNIRISSRLFSSIGTLLPIDPNRVYTGGFAGGARLAAVIPSFIRSVEGVLLCGATIPNTEVLTTKNPFHVVGIVGNRDFNYPATLSVEKFLNKLRFPNQLLIFDGGQEWPKTEYLAKAMEIFTLSAMAKNNIARDSSYVDRTFAENLSMVDTLVRTQQPLMAYKLLNETLDVYQPHKNIDSLRERAKTLKRSRAYKNQNRSQNNAFFKESFLKEDYAYYLEEDVRTYNYNNLGWWTYQMEEISKYESHPSAAIQQMGARLRGYVNALIADTIDVVQLAEQVDLEALNLLWMLKTITDPKAYENYLKVITNSALIDDYGTALFYLEELLKNGYTDKAKLYTLENTALLRITPEFNAIVEKYLKGARYEIIEE